MRASSALTFGWPTSSGDHGTHTVGLTEAAEFNGEASRAAGRNLEQYHHGQTAVTFRRRARTRFGSCICSSVMYGGLSSEARVFFAGLAESDRAVLSVVAEHGMDPIADGGPTIRAATVHWLASARSRISNRLSLLSNLTCWLTIYRITFAFDSVRNVCARL